MGKPTEKKSLTLPGAAQEHSAGGSDEPCCGDEGVCISVGVLGHVDSGKTSICRALSQIVSTCGLDKHPQSKERGITLDLGFSAFSLATPVDPHRCFARNNPKIHNFEASSRSGQDTTATVETTDAAACVSDAEKAASSGHGEDKRQREAQICLVDCPGHASLVRTVIGGSHIIDAAILVVDATKGVQAQTAGDLLTFSAVVKP